MYFAEGIDLTVENSFLNEMALTLGIWLILLGVAVAICQLFVPKILRIVIQPVILLGGIYLLAQYLS